MLSSFPVSLFFNACAEYVHTKSAAKVQKKYDICKCIYEKRAPKRPFSAITSIFLHYLLFKGMRLFVFVEQGIKFPSTNGSVGLAIKKSTFASALPYRNDGRTTVKRRWSDSQSLRLAHVEPKKSPNLCTILYYIFIYNILFKPCFSLTYANICGRFL